MACWAVAGSPEGGGDVCRWWVVRKVVLDAVELAEGCGVEEAGVRAALDQSSGGMPVSKCDRVVEGCASGDDRAVGLDVRAGVKEGVEGVDVVAGGGPVQWRFGVRAGGKPLRSALASMSVAMVAATLG